MEQVWYTAAAWIGLAFLSSLISIRIGISVALVEIFLGFVAGNLGAYAGSAIFQPNAWINFLAGFGSVTRGARRRPGRLSFSTGPWRRPTTRSTYASRTRLYRKNGRTSLRVRFPTT